MKPALARCNQRTILAQVLAFHRHIQLILRKTIIDLSSPSRKSTNNILCLAIHAINLAVPPVFKLGDSRLRIVAEAANKDDRNTPSCSLGDLGRCIDFASAGEDITIEI